LREQAAANPWKYFTLFFPTLGENRVSFCPTLGLNVKRERLRRIAAGHEPEEGATRIIRPVYFSQYVEEKVPMFWENGSSRKCVVGFDV